MAACCCPAGSTEPKRRDPAVALKGEMRKINGLDAYVVGSLPSSGLALIVCEDISGIDSGRTKEIADRFAENIGCLVVLPELLGDIWPESYGAPALCNMPWFIPFLRRNNDLVTTKRFQDSILPFLLEQGATKFAFVGFCLGGCIGTALASDKRFICGATCHAAFQGFGIAGGHTLEEVISAVKCPMLLLPTSNDPKIAQPDGIVHKILVEKAKVECNIEPYSEQVHGFVNRGDIKDEKVSRDVEKALTRVESFIKSKLQRPDDYV